MKLYLCARFSHASKMRLAANFIRAATGGELVIVSRWHEEGRAGQPWDGQSAGAAGVRARENLDDLHEADALLYFNEDPEECRSTHGGRDFIMGYALAFEKLVLFVGRPSHVYCFAPKVGMAVDLQHAIQICGAWHLKHQAQPRGVAALLSTQNDPLKDPMRPVSLGADSGEIEKTS